MHGDLESGWTFELVMVPSYAPCRCGIALRDVLAVLLWTAQQTGAALAHAKCTCVA